jgi:hypothetical protein
MFSCKCFIFKTSPVSTINSGGFFSPLETVTPEIPTPFSVSPLPIQNPSASETTPSSSPQTPLCNPSLLPRKLPPNRRQFLVGFILCRRNPRTNPSQTGQAIDSLQYPSPPYDHTHRPDPFSLFLARQNAQTRFAKISPTSSLPPAESSNLSGTSASASSMSSSSPRRAGPRQPLCLHHRPPEARRCSPLAAEPRRRWPPTVSPFPIFSPTVGSRSQGAK